MLKLASVFETHVGHVRKANEDNHGVKMIDNDTSVFVVCDGMGGHLGGATASRIAVDCILTYLSTNPLDDCSRAIKGAFEFANDQVYAESLNNAELHGMGTTGVVLLVRGNHCYVGHVGDSRIYLQSESRLFRLTKDHSFVQELVDQGIIRDDEAESHPRKNQILRAIGIAPSINAEVSAREIHVKKGDVFLLCTDGLNGMIGDKRINAVLNSQPSLNLKAKELIVQALDAGGKDNVTVALIEIQHSPFETSVFNHFNPQLETRSTEIPTDPEVPRINLWKWLALGGTALAVLGLIAYLFWLKFEPRPDQRKVIDKIELLKIVDEKILLKHQGDSLTGIESSDTQLVHLGYFIEVKGGKIESITQKNEPKLEPENNPTEDSKSKTGSKGQSNSTPGPDSKSDSKKEKEPKPKEEKEKKSSWPKAHKVKAGESLEKIVLKYQNECPALNKESILAGNTQIADPDKIKEGDIITIHCPSKN